MISTQIITAAAAVIETAAAASKTPRQPDTLGGWLIADLWDSDCQPGDGKGDHLPGRAASTSHGASSTSRICSLQGLRERSPLSSGLPNQPVPGIVRVMGDQEKGQSESIWRICCPNGSEVIRWRSLQPAPAVPVRARDGLSFLDAMSNVTITGVQTSIDNCRSSRRGNTAWRARRIRAVNSVPARERSCHRFPPPGVVGDLQIIDLVKHAPCWHAPLLAGPITPHE